jgi:hypothetical protein
VGGYHGVVERSNSPSLRRAERGAIKNNASGKTNLDAVIVRVAPGTASKGQKQEIRIELQPNNARRGRVPPTKPSWVQVGPFEAKAESIRRDGNTVTAEITIPDDAPQGVLLDCHIEFEAPGGGGPGGGPLVYKKNDAFRVVE